MEKRSNTIYRATVFNKSYEGTSKELADKLGYSKRMIYYALSHKRKHLSTEIIRRYVYVVYDLNGNEIYSGSSKDVRKFVGITSNSLWNYVDKNMCLYKKYYINAEWRNVE